MNDSVSNPVVLKGTPFVLFGATILVSAFLLFQVQPLIARAILPWFGGSAAVWTACLVFFQTVLLAGYAYAHLLSTTLRPRHQGFVHLVLLLASVAALPILPAEGWKPGAAGDPTLRILLLLLATVGLPYLLLSTTGPLVQAWFARAWPGHAPYRLYALSNFGSLLALLSYPVVVEPLLSTRTQALGWSGAYVLFAVLSGLLAAGILRLPDPAPRALPSGHARAPGVVDQLCWLALAAVPSILLLSITHHLTQNISPIPFLWVVPLALYLLSFIFTFERDGWYRRAIFVPLGLALAVGAAYTLDDAHKNLTVWILIPLFTATLFVASMVCHGELARMRPAPRHLTSFFLMISVGGAAGGTFVGLAAPRIFSSYLELRLGLVLWLAIMAVVAYRHSATWRGRGQEAFTAVVVAIAAGVAGLLWHQSALVAQDSRLLARNFYGTLRVVESGEGEDAYRAMLHGTISHGKQFLAPDRRDWATTYYAPESGVGRALLALRDAGPQRVGMVGLGTGTLLSYARVGDVYRVYEINPLVVEVAHEHFGYLADAKGVVEIALGDARLTMEREAGQGYDLLAVDAFSSDAIPVHLLTREAFATYFRHVRPGGVVAVHISNRYLDLAPVVKQAAAHFGRPVVRVRNDDDYARGVYSSTWLLLADSPEAIARLKLDDAAESLDDVASVPLWTDEYSNVYELARWRRPD